MKTMFIEVRGKNKSWCFHFYGDPQYLPEWRADGLEVNVIENSVPVWAVKARLLRPYVFLQDVFNFKNPWRK